MANLPAVAADGVSVVYLKSFGTGTDLDPFVPSNALTDGDGNFLTSLLVGTERALTVALVDDEGNQILNLGGGDATAANQVTGNNSLASIDSKLSGTLTVSVSNFPATQAISAVSLPLPTGAATSANQSTILGHIDGIETLLAGTLTVNTGLSQPLTDAQLRASAVPVSGTFWQTTQPISATQLPTTLGVKTAANSLSVAPASDAVFATSLPVTSSATILALTTAATGANYTAFASQACTSLDIVNNTGTTLEYRRNGAGTALQIPDKSARLVIGITNANQISIRRTDTSNTQVTLQAEAFA